MARHKHGFQHCLMCTYFKPQAPDDWKPEYQGQEYDQYRASDRIRERKLHEVGKCTLYPVWVDVQTCHGCGQYEPSETTKQHMPALSHFVWGSPWRRRAEESEGEVARLKKEIKALRAKSQKRLERVRQLESKSKTTPNGSEKAHHNNEA